MKNNNKLVIVVYVLLHSVYTGAARALIYSVYKITIKLLYSLRFSYYLVTLKVPIMNYSPTKACRKASGKRSETSRLESPWG
jgi:hypothetical protein